MSAPLDLAGLDILQLDYLHDQIVELLAPLDHMLGNGPCVHHYDNGLHDLTPIGEVFDELATWARDQQDRIVEAMHSRVPDTAFEREIRSGVLIRDATRNGKSMAEISALALRLAGEVRT